MTDDRQLRDELERVQAEVIRLERALARPDTLHADLRARIDSLRRGRTLQQAKLDDANAQAQKLDDELRVVMSANQQLQLELDDLLLSERGLVSATVGRLDPGPSRAGCTAVLALGLAVVVLRWLT